MFKVLMPEYEEEFFLLFLLYFALISKLLLTTKYPVASMHSNEAIGLLNVTLSVFDYSVASNGMVARDCERRRT
jgi:hypothetical protein